MMQPSPQPIPSAEAIELAAALKADYGANAIVGAKAGLAAAAKSGSAEAIHLWAQVCYVLATDTVLTIRL